MSDRIINARGALVYIQISPSFCRHNTGKTTIMIEESGIPTENSIDQASQFARSAQTSPFQSSNHNALEGAGDGPFAKLIAPEGVRGLFLISFVDLEVILNS